MSPLSHLRSNLRSQIRARVHAAATVAARRRPIAVAACASLVLGTAAVGATANTASAAVATGSPATAGVVSATLQRVQSATSLAQTTGEPQEVTEFTDETTQVMALPDGTFELTSTRSPVRSLEGDTWAPIDTDLSPRNGRIAPGAVVGDVTFSPGGTGPLVSLTEEDDPGTDTVESGTVEIAWDGTPLPTPTLQGSTATYSNVRQGIDLVLTALPSGYTQTLVLTGPAATQDVINNPIDLHLTGDDLTFDTTESGHTTALNSAGETVYDGAAPVLWDSHTATGTTTPGADPETVADPGDGKILPAAATTDPSADATGLAMSIAPPAEAITDPSLVYPLFLDPRLEAPRANYLTVHSRGWNYYNDSKQPMRVGYCNWAECNDAIQGTARSYMSFNIKPVVQLDDTSATVFDAAFRVTQTYNAASWATPVELHRATTFTSNTTWPGPIHETLQTISSNEGYGSDAGGSLMFNNANVVNYIQDLANATQTPRNEGARFALRAPDEGNANQWKKFGTNPTLTIRYSYAPTTPVGLVASGAFQCPGQDRYVDITSNTAFKAVSYTRAAAAVPIEHHFEIFRHPFATYPDRIRYNPDPVTVSSGTYASWAPASSNSNYRPLLIDGVYSARDRARTADPATNGTDPYSSWSNWYDFTIDTAAPATPTIRSDTYPPNYWGSAANATGSFQIASSTDTAAFSYAIDTGTAPTPNNTTCDYPQAASGAGSGYLAANSGKATLTIPAGDLPVGTHSLTVKAFDHAHNLSGTKTYTFMVSPTIAGVPTENRTNRIEAGVGLTLPTASDETNDPQTYLTEADSYTYPDPQPTYGSGGQALRITNATAATTSNPVSTTLKFTPPVDGYYALGVGLITASHFSQLQFTLDDPSDNRYAGEPVPPEEDPTRIRFLDAGRTQPLTVDTYSASVGAKFVPLGDYLPPTSDATVPSDLQADARGVLLNGGKTYTLTVDIVGKNTSSTNYNAMVDYLQLAPLRLAPYTSLAAAFDNAGAGTTSATEFDGITSTQTSLSATALTDAGIIAGQNYTTTLPSGEAVTFPIPAKNGDRDNVISQGQTITTNHPGGSNVYLLATATCGPVYGIDDPTHGDIGGRTLTIDYQIDGSGEHSSAAVNTVPDWRATPKNTSNVTTATTMPTYLNGTSSTSGNASIYVLKFPIASLYQGAPITSITLPRVGTTYRNNNCTTPNSGAQQLHVFSMAIQ